MVEEVGIAVPKVKVIVHYFYSISSMVYLSGICFNTQSSKTARPKPVSLWTVADVQKWFIRHCGEYAKYAELFQKVQ